MPELPRSNPPTTLRTVLAAILALWVTSQLQAVAQRPIAQPRETGPKIRVDPIDEPIRGCGKSRAALRMASRPIDHQPSAVDIAYAVSMGDTDVQHYELSIEVSNLQPSIDTCLLEGTNRMTIQSADDALSEFQFRLDDAYTISSALLNDATPVSPSRLSASTVSVTLDRTYTLGETFTLTIEYSGQTDSGGMGSIEVDTQPDGTPIVSTLSEPYFAHNWWPCKDGDIWTAGDNSDKATIDFSITAPSGMTAVSNGALTQTVPVSGGRTRFDWSTGYPTATYLVAFAATEYNTWTQQYAHAGGSMPVEFYIYPYYDHPSYRDAWNRSVDMLATFATIYGEYPFINEKYGIYNFSFGGGMEHQTASGQGGFGESLTAHELGHQWWGDAITCETWSDIWLNEGFATYSECLWEELKEGARNEAAYHAAVLTHKPTYTGDTVYIPRSETSSVSRIFNYNATYLKACWVLHQLRHVVGDHPFFDFLDYYRAEFEDDAVSTAEFINTANDFFQTDMSWFFDQWLYEPGSPEYRYGWDFFADDGRYYLLAHIEQVQAPPYPDVFTMPVDLHVDSPGGVEVVTAFNDAREQWFALPITNPPIGLELDPDEWILSYLRQEVAYVPGPPKIVRTEPPAGQTAPEGEPVTELLLILTAPTDVAPGDFHLVGAAEGDVSFTLSTGPLWSEVRLTFDQPLGPDVYTLTVADTVTEIANGLALDGEIEPGNEALTVPSGDGVPGGAATLTFGVPVSIPAASTWSLAVFALALTSVGTLIVRRRAHEARAAE